MYQVLDMGYSIEIDEQNHLILVKYDELCGFDDRVSVLEELARHLSRDPRLNIFVDASLVRENLSEVEQEKFGEMLGKYSEHFSSNRTAIYNPNKLNKLAIADSYVLGHTRFVEFTNKATAILWVKREID